MNVTIPRDELASLLALAKSEVETRVSCLKDAGDDRAELEDEISDAQDTLAAGRRAVELHQPQEDVRHPYYEMGDKLAALEEAVSSDAVMDDDKILSGILRGLRVGYELLHRHLNAKYRWD